ncbi:MAG: iron ABC transporter permease [Nevskiaceae bacterium]|nr:MAG: iron ABC transporter permease [Nevskiaceae bacterium]TBR74894.1 MAG: iron ABC transporter permease [Nevskiaceae bacterium]
MLGSAAISPLAVWDVVLSRLPGLGHFASQNWPAAYDTIIWDLRLPRVVLSALVGAGLGLAGVGIQALVRNSLADPYILGVSSGASLGATLVLLFGAFAVLGPYALAIAAFLGALAAILVVITVSQVAGRITTTRLLLSGIALSLVLGAAISTIFLVAPNNDRLRSALFWMMGSFNGASWAFVPLVAAVVAAAFAFLLLQARALNLLLLGEEAAVTLGLDVNRFRRQLVVVVAVVTGVLVAASGPIGFVGLMVPHLARVCVGPDHRRVLVVSLLSGAIFMVGADIVARVVIAPAELPIGAVTALVGGPFFIWLLRRSRYTFGA